MTARQQRSAAWSFPFGERKAARALTSRWAEGHGHSSMYLELICSDGCVGVTTADSREICSVKSLKAKKVSFQSILNAVVA